MNYFSLIVEKQNYYEWGESSSCFYFTICLHPIYSVTEREKKS